MREPSINHAEPGDLETLDMNTAYVHSWNSLECVRIGVLPEEASGPDGTVSFTLVHFKKARLCEHLQANLNQQEIDVVIKGLQDAKERMEKL